MNSPFLLLKHRFIGRRLYLFWKNEKRLWYIVCPLILGSYQGQLLSQHGVLSDRSPLLSLPPSSSNTHIRLSLHLLPWLWFTVGFLSPFASWMPGVFYTLWGRSFSVDLPVSCNGNSLHQLLDDQSTDTERRTSLRYKWLRVYKGISGYNKITSLMAQLLPLNPSQNIRHADMTKIMPHFGGRIFASTWALWFDPAEQNSAILCLIQ